MTDILGSLGVFVREVTLAGKKVIPEPIRRKPTCLVVRAILVNIAYKALIRCRLSFMKRNMVRWDAA
jgi:hypothetical protein